MDEFKFVFKCMLVTVMLLLVIQFKIGNVTVESYVQDYAHQSGVALYLQQVASGGTLALRNAGELLSGFTARTFGHGENQKASRIDLNFRRSPAVKSASSADEE